MAERDLADRRASAGVSPPETIAKGFFNYQRFRVTLADAVHTREVVRAGRVAAVLPVDLARGEIVMIRQFRLAAHLANGNGELVEIVAGRAEPGEILTETAARECHEEIGIAPTKLVELFTYLTTPGLTDEEVTVFVAAVDAARVPERTQPTRDERITVIRVPITTALDALAHGTMHNGPLVIALQWLALNRDRLPELLGATG
jgi:ADP-ribose pyrophosphatase